MIVCGIGFAILFIVAMKLLKWIIKDGETNGWVRW